MEDFEYAKDYLIMGIERKNLAIDATEFRNTAIHETGHVLAAYYTADPSKIYKVTINPRGESLGAVLLICKLDLSNSK